MNMSSKYIVKKKECDDKGISVDMFYYLVALHEGSKINRRTFNELGKTGYICYKGFDEKGYLIEPTITQEGVDLITEILVNSNMSSMDIKRYEEIAKEMREIFPKGKKEGTVYMWRDSVPVIARRLKAVTGKYGYLPTKAEILDATKRYVDSFNGDYRYMQLLKYFISKQTIAPDGTTEETSQLFSYIMNKDDVTNTTNDGWTTELR